MRPWREAARAPAAPVPAHEPVIEVRDLHKRLGGHVVLDGVRFEVRTGETLVILGRELVGLPRAELYALRLQIGVLFQGAALLDSMNVRENITLGLRTHTDLGEPELERIAAEKLAQVGLPGIGDLMPAELSGGMRKRVGLARAIAMDPRIILYDEPTTGLDPVMADVINDLILQEARAHVTSIIVTHDMTSALKVGTRFLMLHRGQMLFDGDAAALGAAADPRVAGFISGRAEALDLLQ